MYEYMQLTWWLIETVDKAGMLEVSSPDLCACKRRCNNKC